MSSTTHGPVLRQALLSQTPNPTHMTLNPHFWIENPNSDPNLNCCQMPGTLRASTCSTIHGPVRTTATASPTTPSSSPASPSLPPPARGCWSGMGRIRKLFLRGCAKPWCSWQTRCAFTLWCAFTLCFWHTFQWCELCIESRLGGAVPSHGAARRPGGHSHSAFGAHFIGVNCCFRSRLGGAVPSHGAASAFHSAVG